MSDKELSDYIKTIDPKFNSNLEKGTIEMTNEYYNLLEEYISRLNNKKDLYKSVLDKIKEKGVMYYDPEYSKIYGELCSMAGANNTRTPVIVIDDKILELLEEIE